MPPGWIKAVNSRTLMESFTTVDKVLNRGEKKSNSRKCEACFQYFLKKEEFSQKKTKIIMDALENLNCDDYSHEQMAKILVGMKTFIETGDINEDFRQINKEEMSSCSPHLLHFSRSEMIDLCTPSIRTMESFLILYIY